MDNFCEQLIGTYKTFSYRLANFSFYLFSVLTAILMLTFSFIPSVACLIIALLLFYFKKNLYVEYEYEFTNGEIDIDKILEMKRRKNILYFNIKDVELIAPEDSNHVRDFSNKPQTVLTCFPKTSSDQVYVAMITGGNERLQLRFTPNEEFLECCRKYNPRAVKKY